VRRRVDHTDSVHELMPEELREFRPSSAATFYLERARFWEARMAWCDESGLDLADVLAADRAAIGIAWPRPPAGGE